MPNQPKTPLRSVRVPDDVWNAAQALARANGANVSEVVRAALLDYVRQATTTTSAYNGQPVHVLDYDEVTRTSRILHADGTREVVRAVDLKAWRPRRRP